MRSIEQTLMEFPTSSSDESDAREVDDAHVCGLKDGKQGIEARSDLAGI